MIKSRQSIWVLEGFQKLREELDRGTAEEALVQNRAKPASEAASDVNAGFPHLQGPLRVTDAFKAHIDQRRYDPPPREDPELMEGGGPF